MTDTIYFTETQRFTQWYMWLLLIAVNLLLFYLLFRSINNKKMKARRFACVVLGATSLMVLAVTVLMFTIRLETEISDPGIHVKFYPMDSEKRFCTWDSIATANVRYYDPTGE